MKGSVFSISLDFELLWGVKDHRSIQSYGSAIIGGRDTLYNVLDIFSKYNIHATWASVGLLMYDQKQDLLASIPARKPAYQKTKLSNYECMEDLKDSESLDPYHYGKSLINKIIQTPGQELASHTYSHYYCLEPGQTIDDFEIDTVAFEKACKPFQQKTYSIVFPRNQYNPEYLGVLSKHGFVCFRGNEKHWLYESRIREEETLWRRLLRLCDAYINISGHHTYKLTKNNIEEGLLNIPASRFFRPYVKRLSALEKLKVNRIKQSMKYAAIHGEVFHLWWHPHNFGLHPLQMLEQLEEILVYYKFLQQKYGMESLSMKEVEARYFLDQTFV